MSFNVWLLYFIYTYCIQCIYIALYLYCNVLYLYLYLYCNGIKILILIMRLERRGFP